MSGSSVTCAEKQFRVIRVLSTVLIQRTRPRCPRRLSSWGHAVAPAWSLHLHCGLLFFFNLDMGVFVCLLVCEMQVLSANLVLLLIHTDTHPHTHCPPPSSPYLHDCSLVHWETGRWCHSCVNIAMATSLFPLPTTPHTQRSHSPTPTNLKTHTHTHTRSHTQTYTLNPQDCIRCRTNLIHMPRQPSLKSPFTVQVSFS